MKNASVRVSPVGFEHRRLRRLVERDERPARIARKRPDRPSTARARCPFRRARCAPSATARSPARGAAPAGSSNHPQCVARLPRACGDEPAAHREAFLQPRPRVAAPQPVPQVRGPVGRDFLGPRDRQVIERGHHADVGEREFRPRQIRVLAEHALEQRQRLRARGAAIRRSPRAGSRRASAAPRCAAARDRGSSPAPPASRPRASRGSAARRACSRRPSPAPGTPSCPSPAGSSACASAAPDRPGAGRAVKRIVDVFHHRRGFGQHQVVVDQRRDGARRIDRQKAGS